MTVDEIRAIRALWRRRHSLPPEGRQLVYQIENSEWKTCRWCRKPTERGTWHKVCLRVYFMAKGQTVYTGGNRIPLYWEENAYFRNWRKISKWLGENPGRDRSECPHLTACSMCGRQGIPIEIDHTIALSIAREAQRRGYRRWWRAWLYHNMRPLCHECHQEKSRADRVLLKQLRAEEINGERREPYAIHGDDRTS